MSNLHDYLLWRGDLKICNDFKFNELDSAILARFSYLPFDKIDYKDFDTIETISLKMRNFENEDFIYAGDKELIYYMGHCNRFKNLKVSDYEKNNCDTAEKQFSAITIHLSDSEMYLSYMGTDMSIMGWKEDFNLAFLENMPAQFDGLKYTEEIAKKYNRLIRMGGHSKGGNIAIYSALSVSKSIKDRIIKVYNYDGPGFNKNTISKFGDDEIYDKIVTYIPQDSVIGRLLNHKEKFVVVESVGKGIYQHDIFSWRVLKDDFIELKEVTQNSELINDTLEKWIIETNPEERKIFVDTAFEILFSSTATSFVEFSNIWIKKLPEMINTYKGISDEDKKRISEMIKIFISTYIENKKKMETKVIKRPKFFK